MNLKRNLCKEFILKLLRNIAIVALLLAMVPFAVDAKKARKLPMGAYIKSAKIHILSGDLKRYVTAIAMLDSLFMHYGPTAEAIQLRGSIEVDYIDRAVNLEEKMLHVSTLVAYMDSLNVACDKDNKDVKKKYKKGCDNLIKKNDSLVVNYWREFYNNGINFMNANDISTNVTSIQEDIAVETDSSLIEQFKLSLQAHADSSIANFELCIVLNPTDVRAYVGMRSLFDKLKDHENAIKALVRGLDYAEDRATLLQTISYDFINMGDYGGAIPYMREYTDLRPDDVLTLGNLGICFRNQKMFDSAFAVSQRVLAVDPVNVEALKSTGHHFRKVFIDAADSARSYSDAENDAEAKKWTQVKDDYIDTTLAYYKRVIDVDPKNEQIQYLYATYNYIISNWELAISAFKAASEINPNESDYWKSLGDCYIQTKDYANSAAAYEKVIEIKPKDKDVWEQLVSLYSELKQPKDKANAQKQFDALK